MSFLLPIALVFTFMASSPSPERVSGGPMPPPVIEVQIDDQKCMAPCQIDEKGEVFCPCTDNNKK